MLIAGATLLAEYDRALAAWPFIPEVERAHGLPALLLFAVGSQETNLENETGDGGHGRGVWQLDDRSHHIPAGFADDVRHQAEVAASMLAENLRYYGGQLFPAVCAYNAGIGNADAGIRNHGSPDYWTTHANGVGYGAEVLARHQWLTTYVNHKTAGVVARPAPLPRWYVRELAFPVSRYAPTAVTGKVVRIKVTGGVALAQAGPDVEHVQHLVGALGDGIYGPETKLAVARWQTRRKLRSDGVFGPISARDSDAGVAP